MHTPTRSLNLAGATNFRDLGGYRTEHGRSVRWRRLFRSDHLAGLTPEDRHALAALGLTRALDFRGVDESAAASYALPGVSRHALPIEPTVVQNINAMLQAGHRLTARDAVALMQQTYRAFVLDNAPRFAELFRHLLDDDAPLVFHCTAGKDRTGFAAALILLALGVARDVVVQDYLLTNQLFQQPPSAHGEIPPEALAVLWRVQQGFLDAALHAVDADHGGLETYLARRLRLSRAAQDELARRYLQPP